MVLRRVSGGLVEGGRGAGSLLEPQHRPIQLAPSRRPRERGPPPLRPASGGRSLSAPSSSTARRPPIGERDDVGLGVLEREGLTGAVTGAKARFSAACAVTRVAEMYCSTRLQRSWGFVVFVMRDEFARTEIDAQPLP